MSTYQALKKRQYLRKDVTTTPKKTSTPSSMVLYKIPRSKSLTNPRMADPGPELKNIDVSGSIGVIVGTQWSELDLLNPIAQGAASNARVGRNVQLKSLMFRWNTSSVTWSSIRVLIVYDREPNLALPLITDVLVQSNFNSPMNLSNGNRFVILADELHNNEGLGVVNNNSANTAQTRSGKIFKKLNLPMKFEGTSTDITSITQGAIFAMIAIPFPWQGGGTAPGIGYISRIRYTDV